MQYMRYVLSPPDLATTRHTAHAFEDKADECAEDGRDAQTGMRAS